MIRKTLFLCAATVLIPLSAARADSCAEQAQRRAALNLEGAREVSIEAHAGSLSVRGEEGATTVTAEGTACAPNRRMLDQTRLLITRSGDRIRIVAEVPEDGWLSSGARLDMKVTVPKGIPVSIEDGSGWLEARNLGPLTIRDGSGSIEVSEIAGNLRIDDGSGSITVHGITGDVRVDDGSGSMEISEVTGSVIVEDDGSGEITARHIGKDVIVEDDGSGSIDVEDVGGDFVVRSDGSGGVHYEQVKGSVRIPRD